MSLTISIISLLGTFILSAIIGVLSIPRIVDVANKMHLYDQPNSRKIHRIPIPRLGGVSFIPAALISLCTVAVLLSRFGYKIENLADSGAPQHFIAYIAGAVLLYSMGIFDDVRGLGYKIKFLVQVISAVLLCISGLWIASFEHIFLIDQIPFWVGMPLTIFFVVYVTNAINLIDGIDGLASGLSSISLIVAIILCIMSGDILWAMLAIAFLGVVTVFFCFNVFGNKHKIFMGDTGSLTLGYTLSYIFLHFWQANPIWNPYLHNLGIIMLSTLIIPMFDVVRVFMSRVRDNRNPFLPDKNHIHHKLMRTGMNGRQTMISLLLLSVLFIVINYIVASYISQTLIILINVLMYVVMHIIINYFIQKKEKETGGRNWKKVF